MLVKYKNFLNTLFLNELMPEAKLLKKQTKIKKITNFVR